MSAQTPTHGHRQKKPMKTKVARSTKNLEKRSDGVLIDQGRPRRILPIKTKVTVRIDKKQKHHLRNGIKKEYQDKRLLEGNSYLIFEQTREEYLVGILPDKDQAFGWVKKSDVDEWKTRYISIDKRKKTFHQKKPVKAKEATAAVFTSTELTAALGDLSELFALIERPKKIADLGDIKKIAAELFKNYDFLKPQAAMKTLNKAAFTGNDLAALVPLLHDEMDRVAEIFQAASEPNERDEVFVLMQNLPK